MKQRKNIGKADVLMWWWEVLYYIAGGSRKTSLMCYVSCE